MASSFLRFLDHIQRRTTVGRTPLDVISSSQRPLPDNTQHSQQTNIRAPVGFKPTISAGERPQTYALDRAATGTGFVKLIMLLNLKYHKQLIGWQLYVLSGKSAGTNLEPIAVVPKTVCFPPVSLEECRDSRSNWTKNNWFYLKSTH